MPMLTSDHRVEVLANAPLFGGFSHRDLRKVAKQAEEIQVHAGDHLCEEGEHGEWCFILVDVGAKVSVAGQSVATLAPGEICGELSLLDGGPRAATVTVDGDGSVLIVSRSAFLELLEAVPSLVSVVLASFGERLRTANAVSTGSFLTGG
ncbi:MAG TPA: cyclic nucleotide-binding domain-containing protein [Acidimicrobiales bacterium]|nr:cyclic nucleotide-binding domain-containing protein [Acidimicrobiales bacterium]